MSQDQAMQIARKRFGAKLADTVHLERADFGWIARVDEVVVSDGRIGHSVLAIGPDPMHAHFYPAGPSARVRRAHLVWLENLARVTTDVSGPPSFN
jgi:hypothetical protein